MYMYNVMLAVMEGGCGCAFFICDGLMAAVADPHFKLKAHEWDGRALGAALAAHSLPTLPAVVLSQPNFLTVPHLFEVPEERLVTLLAGITVQPLRGLLPFHIHVPDDNATVATTGDELSCVLRIGEGLDFVIVSLELDGCPFSPADVPHDDRVIGTARE